MAAPIKLLYGSPTAITCSIDGLASGSYWQSDAVDNTSDLFIDVLLTVSIVFPADDATGAVIPYMIPSLDGTNFDFGATGSDGAYTLPAPPTNSFYPEITPYSGVTSQATASMSYEYEFVPPFWSIVIFNNTGFTLGTGCTLSYVGVKAQVG